MVYFDSMVMMSLCLAPQILCGFGNNKSLFDIGVWNLGGCFSGYLGGSCGALGCVCVWPRPVPGFPLVLFGFVLAHGLFGLLKPVRTMLPMGVSLFEFTFYSGISSQYQCVECF